jgi:hypothetical protein
MKTSILIMVLAGLVVGMDTRSSSISAPSLVSQTTNSQLGKPIRVELVSSVVVLPDRVEIKVLSIQDSRCPKNIDCYWGGEAQVQLNLRRAGKNLGDLNLTLGVGNPNVRYPNNIKRIGKYYVRVLAVDPYSERNLSNLKSVDQSVTLQIQKTPFKLEGS